MIHSSPYVRCVQTSLAIAAGIQHPQNHVRPRTHPRQRSSRSNLSPTEEVEPPVESNETIQLRPHNTVTKNDRETNRLGYNTATLRIDPFLGEWLSPTYFGNNPPPPSAVVVSEAKMALQAPQEEIKGADLYTTLPYDTSLVDGDEKENELTSTQTQEKTGLKAMAAVGHSLPKRPRNISFGTELANGARMLNRALQRQHIGYSPPTPTYAITPSDKIPPGFIAHARDSCVTIDFDWDSQHEPLGWGDGGSFEEEWSSMHRRFRNGLQKLISHYETEGTASAGRGTSAEEDDLVIVLVTHQAGCNALIRLLTGAPALHEVGTASLTLAVRSMNDQPPSSPASPTRRRGSLDLSLSDDYDVKIIASTEHLRHGSNVTAINSPRLNKSPVFASRRAVGGDIPETFNLGESLNGRGPNSTRPARSMSERLQGGDEAVMADNETGLWRRGSRYSRDETADSSDATMLSSRPTTNSIPDEPSKSGSNLDIELNHLPVRSASQGGLWGVESIKGERSPGKRRWTAVGTSP